VLLLVGLASSCPRLLVSTIAYALRLCSVLMDQDPAAEDDAKSFLRCGKQLASLLLADCNALNPKKSSYRALWRVGLIVCVRASLEMRALAPRTRSVDRYSPRISIASERFPAIRCTVYML
jgi:hypothetical protein